MNSFFILFTQRSDLLVPCVGARPVDVGEPVLAGHLRRGDRLLVPAVAALVGRQRRDRSTDVARTLRRAECRGSGGIAVVAAEYIGASAGLGLMITNAATSLATPVVIAGMIVIGIIGAGVSALIGWLSRARLDYR